MELSSTSKYYFVSDLHMGGDGQLQHCDYAPEFIEFLKKLEQERPDTELLIVGDTFGSWELTLVQGVEKLDHITHARGVFETSWPGWPSRGQHGNLAEALTSYHGPLWPVA